MKNLGCDNWTTHDGATTLPMVVYTGRGGDHLHTSLLGRVQVSTTLGVAARAKLGMGDREQHETKVKYNQVVMDSPIL
jgi:hypothetical protein